MLGVVGDNVVIVATKLRTRLDGRSIGTPSQGILHGYILVEGHPGVNGPEMDILRLCSLESLHLDQEFLFEYVLHLGYLVVLHELPLLPAVELVEGDLIRVLILLGFHFILVPKLLPVLPSGLDQLGIVVFLVQIRVLLLEIGLSRSPHLVHCLL